MNNTLLLHIGTIKTGSTSLQKFLYNNAKKIEAYGWKYPYINHELEELGIEFDNIDFKNGSVFNASWKVRVDELESADKQDWTEMWDIENRFEIDSEREAWLRTWEIINNHLRDSNVIISEELISWRNTVSFLETAKRQYDNIKVIIYLRRQDRFFESAWNQYVKYALVAQEFDVDRLNLEKYDYLSLIDGIAQIVGKQNIIVKVYEKEQLIGSDIILDFLDVLKIPNDVYIKEECAYENAGLSGNMLDIKRIFNQYINEQTYYKENMKNIFNIGKSVSGGNIKQVGGYLTKEQREKILDFYAESNEQIAKEYLGRDDGQLFRDTRIDIEKSVCQYDAMYGDIVGIMANVINSLYKEKDKMENRLNYMTNNLLMLKCGKRKLCLWGAGRMCKDILKKYALTIDCIIDNNKRQEEINGVQVVSPEEIVSWKDYFIVIACRYDEEISSQLNQYGLNKHEDYVLAKDYFWGN